MGGIHKEEDIPPVPCLAHKREQSVVVKVLLLLRIGLRRDRAAFELPDPAAFQEPAKVPGRNLHPVLVGDPLFYLRQGKTVCAVYVGYDFVLDALDGASSPALFLPCIPLRQTRRGALPATVSSSFSAGRRRMTS